MQGQVGLCMMSWLLLLLCYVSLRGLVRQSYVYLCILVKSIEITILRQLFSSVSLI